MKETELKGKKKTALLSVLVAAWLIVTLVAGTNMGYNVGFKAGYLHALTDIADKTGITFEWKDLGDGRYEITAFYNGTLFAKGYSEIHLSLEHWRDGKLLSSEFGAGVLTTIGKNWIEQQLAASDGSQEALYCADSNDATDPPLAAWTILPSEIAANGLDRQTGVYASTGDGAWNVTVTKSVTGTQSTQLWGLHWVVTDSSDDNLLAADSGPAQKNCVSGDTLKETWQMTVS